MTIDPDQPITIRGCIYPPARKMAASIMASAPKGAAQRVQRVIDNRRALKHHDLADYYTTVMGLLPLVN